GPKDKMLGQGITCDQVGCIGRLADGTVVAISRTVEAFEEDCRRAALVVTARGVPPDCAAVVVDRTVWRQGGAVALRHVGKGWIETMSRPPGYDRPWAPARPRPATGLTTSASAPPQPGDASPNTNDLDPGDQ